MEPGRFTPPDDGDDFLKELPLGGRVWYSATVEFTSGDAIMRRYSHAAFVLFMFLVVAGCQPLEAPAKPIAEAKAPIWALNPPRADAAPIVRFSRDESDYGPEFLPDKNGDLHTGCSRKAYSTQDINWGEPGKVSLIVFPNEHVAFGGWDERRGFAARAINRSENLFVCGGCDGSLNMVMEAIDVDGEWKAIESIPTSGCGVSYMIRNKLETDRFWQFTVPEFAGPFKTRLRLRWDVNGGIYSNEFEGSINPEQFVNPPANHH